MNTGGLTTSPGILFGGRGTGGLVHSAGDDEAILATRS
jgi:hypothetical protein